MGMLFAVSIPELLLQVNFLKGDTRKVADQKHVPEGLTSNSSVLVIMEEDTDVVTQSTTTAAPPSVAGNPIFSIFRLVLRCHFPEEYIGVGFKLLRTNGNGVAMNDPCSPHDGRSGTEMLIHLGATENSSFSI
jgi:hypothetical protein